MHKWMRALMAVVLTAVLIMPGAALAEEMDMKDMDMKDMSMYYDGVETVSSGGKEYVQLRQLAEKLGYMIGWDGRTRTVTLAGMMEDMNKVAVELMIGSMTFTYNGMVKELAAAPMIRNGRTYVTKAFADMYLINMM